MLCRALHGAGTRGGRLAGVVADEASGLPVELADVALFRAADSAFVAGAVTDARGRFAFASVVPGRYYVECSFVGYGLRRSPVFAVDGRGSTDLGALYLCRSSGRLGEVVVRGRRSTYVQHLGKRVFNVGTDLMSAAGSVSDLMRNIPSVQVDVDGNVSLRGSESVNIQIDGKPSALMSARTRADALRQIPAGEVERIEVITNPSAQYKPDGVSGIINLVMKSDRRRGWSGSVAANAGTLGRANATASVAYGTGRVNLTAAYGIRRDLYEPRITDDRSRSDSLQAYTSQLTTGTAHPLSHTARAGVDWKATGRDRLRLSGSYTRRHFIRTESIVATDMDANHGVTGRSARYRHDNENVNGWEAGGSYTHTFGKGNELTADYSYSSLEGLEDNRYATYSTGGDTKDNTQIWQAYYRHLFRMTWRRTLGAHLKLCVGYELDALRTDLNYHVQSLEGDAFVPDMTRTNDFTNLAANHALYATLEYKRGAWGLLLGLRPELMRIRSRLRGRDSTVSDNYLMAYPTLHASYAIDGHNELLLNYSLRVNRPEADDLNPFPEYQNPLTLRAGNPYLRPEKVHSVEAGWRWKRGGTTLLATLYYRYTANKLTELTRYLPGNVLLTTKENLNSGSSAGAEVIADAEIGKWATVNLSGNLFYDRIDATRLGYAAGKDALAWSVSLNANFTPCSNTLLQLNSRYLSPALMPQGRREGSFSTDIGVKYELPRRGLSFTATLSDVFNTLRKVYTIDTPQLRQRLEQKMSTCVLYVGVAWNFSAERWK